MGAGQDHRRGPRAAARARLQRLSRRVEVDPERLAGWVDRFVRRHGEISLRAEDANVTLTAPDGATATLIAPWPSSLAPRLREYPGDVSAVTSLVDRFVAEALRPRAVALLLVRRGGFAVGVADGPRLVDSKVGRRHVQGKTKAGGWSQQRYARRRDAQAQEAFAAAAEAAVRILLPHRGRLDGLVTGGDRAAVAAVLEDPRLRSLGDLARSRFLAVPDPRQRVLEDAVWRARAVAIDVYDPLRD